MINGITPKMTVVNELAQNEKEEQVLFHKTFDSPVKISVVEDTSSLPFGYTTHLQVDGENIYTLTTPFSLTSKLKPCKGIKEIVIMTWEDYQVNRENKQEGRLSVLYIMSPVPVLREHRIDLTQKTIKRYEFPTHL